VHDGGLGHRSTLSAVTRSLGLAGALLVELIDGGLVQVSTGRPGSRHQPLSADGDTTLLQAMPGYDNVKDPALQQVYAILVRNTDERRDSDAFFDDLPRPIDSPAHRGGHRGDQGRWTDNGHGRAPAYGDNNPAGGSTGWNTWSQDAANWRPDQSGYQANYRGWPNEPAPPARALGSGMPVRNVIEFLAIENRAEQLVVNRLLTTGLVRYETRRRLFGADTKVIVPANSVISGRALARIVAGLQPVQPYSRRPDGDRQPEGNPTAPRGLNEFDKRMAALFAAAGVFDVDQTGLTGNEMRVLRAELQTGIPAAVTAVLRQVSLVVKSFALNR
jgi:hypothetical protein